MSRAATRLLPSRGAFRRYCRSIVERLEPRVQFSAFTVTNLNDNGPGSLRQAVLDANANAGTDSIVVGPGVVGEVVLTSGQLEVTGDVTIAGGHVAVSGNQSSRVLDVDASSHVMIDNMYFLWGRAPAVQSGGGILNSGVLTLDNCVVENCAAALPYQGSGDGGGVFNSGTLTLIGCTISDNTAGENTSATQDPAMPGGDGGGIASSGTLVLEDCTITGNRAGSGAPGGYATGNAWEGGAGGNGGGIAVLSGSATVYSSTFAANSAGAGGHGGMITFSVGAGGPGGSGGAVSSDGTLTIGHCTMSGNHAGSGGEPGVSAGAPYGASGGAGGDGGGVAALHGNFLVYDSTLGGNFAGAGAAGGDVWPSPWSPANAGNGGAGGRGGGIYAVATGKLYNSTLSGNQFGVGGPGGRLLYVTNGNPGADGVPGAGGGAADATPNATSVANSIIAANGPSAASGSDVSGYFFSEGHNLIGETNGASGWRSDRFGEHVAPLDARLAPLGNYGGPTQTFALMPGSLAIDDGDTAIALAHSATDQRGFARVFNSVVDIGAFEAQPPAATGDVNHDGTVAFSDLLQLAQKYGGKVPLFENGDLTGDGSVNFDDLLLIAQHYGHGAASHRFTPNVKD